MVPAQECATRALGRALRDQPLSAAKVRFAWTTAVGAGLAQATTVRLTADGTLEVHTASEHWRRETQRSRLVIRERLGALLGPDVIRAIIVTGGGADHA